jgi:DNA polymerase II small subunit
MVEHVKEIIKVFLDKGYLIDPELIDRIDLDIEFLSKNLDINGSGELLMFNKYMMDKLLDKGKNIELEKPLVESEMNTRPFEIIKSFDKKPRKVSVQDFVTHYNNRYNSLRKILQNRNELIAPLSISRILSKRERDRVSTIGLVYEKRYTKNNNLILRLEDNTGSINVLVNNNKPELFEKCKNMVLDEAIGVKGSNGEKIIFADDIFFPDVALTGTEMKKSEKEEYVAFISDIHIGSNVFFEKEFLDFVKWINGKTGSSEQKEIAKSVKYLFIVGDIVDGIGIYPGQDNELSIFDIREQYDKCAELLDMIRKDVQIFICPGNHDAIRLAEPQPVFDADLAEGLYKIENIELVSNPSLINIGSYEGFSGFDVLMYHGFSFDYYIDQIESIRFGGGYDRGDLVMKFLLQKRHLAPTHGSTPIIIDTDLDNLIIDKIPDFFASGHLHKISISNYGKTTMISGSCWQGRTTFQDKVGHHPEPGRVPLINLKTRDVKLMKFCD